MSSYATITDFGASLRKYDDPTLYCTLDGLDSQFMYGSTGFQKGNFKCSEYMSNRCAAQWDSVCEAISQSPQSWYPRPMDCPVGLTDGQAMLRETAFKKYLLQTRNCWFACEPFDPTVAESPLVCYETQTAPSSGTNPALFWTLDGRRVSGGPVLDNPPCEKLYGFTDRQMTELDQDPVMHHLLRTPNVALDLLQKLAVWVQHTGNRGKILHTQFDQFAQRNYLYSK